ncbi:MAG: hypothetical protein L3K08_01435 [Thermoplasmata archaeon]|nr:hypothetical protein [Thermoplasmata archaeon]
MPPAPGESLTLRPTPEDRKKLIELPGPSWSEWFYGSFLKVWIALGFLIVDSWIIGYWVEAGQAIGIIPSVAVAVYLEYLGFQALWYRPRSDVSHSVRTEARRRWLYPVEFGRWTPEGRRVRAGLPPYGKGEEPQSKGPDPHEFF